MITIADQNFGQVTLLEHSRMEDNRGAFYKDYSHDELVTLGIPEPLKEVFHTVSRTGVIRGIHYQDIVPQPKLVTCLSGEIVDVVVDLRPDSPTYRKYVKYHLTGDDNYIVHIPAGFGHAYEVLDDSIVCYKTTAPFLASGDRAIRYDDPSIHIDWKTTDPILSQKDLEAPYLH